ncbi:MAG: hypothetical protein M3P85_02805 [Actinomycetota bacterium]|nr:hypothetical protein [Actinomycetota bacterium]
MTTLVRPRIAAAAFLALAGTTFLASPARAHAPTVDIRTILDRETTDDFPIVADVSHEGGNITGSIVLTIAPLGDQPPVGVPPAQAGNEKDRQTVSFTVKGIEYNGEYQAEVSAKASQPVLPLGLSGHQPMAASGTRKFAVAVPPAPPGDVRAAIDPDTRVVTITWKRNPEKDIVGYFVARNGADPVATVETSFTDASTANAGGTYVYKVQAVRRGATANQGLTSDPVTTTATVPGPPGPPTTVGAGGTTTTTTPGAGGTTATRTPGAGGGGTGTGSTPGGTTGTTLAASSPGALKKSGTIDLSGFSSIQSQARRPAPRVVERDPGFTSTLPFNTTNTTRLVDGEQAGAPEPGRAAGGDDPEVRELGAEDASNNRQQSAAFLAAGLLATVLLMHLLWIKGEVQREPLEALVPE